MLRGNVDYSYRDLDHGQFVKEFDECVNEEDKPVHRCRGEVEEKMKHAESGRFYEMVDTTQRQLAAMDQDEVELFAERNPGMMARVKEHGTIMGGARFKNVETPHDDELIMDVTPTQRGEFN